MNETYWLLALAGLATVAGARLSWREAEVVDKKIGSAVEGAKDQLGDIVSFPRLESIAVEPERVVIPRGTTQRLSAIGTYADGSTAPLTSTVTWSSSNEGIAKVHHGGEVLALASGGCEIIATLGSVQERGTVLVRELRSIELQPVNPTIVSGATQQFRATAIYEDGQSVPLPPASLIWSSTTPAVATITGDGLATGRSVGETEIRARLQSVPESQLGVSNLRVSAATTSSSPTAASGQGAIHAEGTPSPTTRDVIGTGGSMVGHLASVRLSGVVEFMRALPLVRDESTSPSRARSMFAVAGLALLLSASISIADRIVSAVETTRGASITVSPATPTVLEGETLQLTAVVHKEGSVATTAGGVNWSSSDPKIAMVGRETGQATGVKKGETNIVVTWGSLKGSVKLTVKEKPS